MSAPPDKTEADPVATTPHHSSDDPLVTAPEHSDADPYATVPPQPAKAASDTEGDATIDPWVPPTPKNNPDTDGEVTTDPWSTVPPQAAEPNRSRSVKTALQVRLPGYDILRELGRGGMGVVYLARQQGLKRLVALKMILSGDHASAQQSMRFRAEAEAVGHLKHPNIVQIYEIGENEGRPYFSLEFVDGGNLQEKYRGAPQPANQAARMVEVLARAVHYAHQQGIVHRDLKPANVLLMQDGTPKITDFGLAKRLDSGEGQTASGVIMGTPCYMAPEQASGRIDLIQPATDVYALGAILYEFLTGQPPLIASSDWETIRMVIDPERDPEPPSRRQPKVSRDLDTICLKSLAKEPSKRYDSAEALADDLQRFLDNEPIQARPVPAWERAWKWARRRPTLAGLLLASAVALGSFGAYKNQVRIQEDEKRVQEEEKNEQLTLLRQEVERLTDRARLSMQNKNWEEARTCLDSARKMISNASGLTGMGTEVDVLLNHVTQRLKAMELLTKFRKARDDAFFEAVLCAGDPTPTKVERTMKATREALAVIDLTPEASAAPQRGPEFTDSEKESLASDAYELRLFYAVALVSTPGRTDKQRRQDVQAALVVMRAAKERGKNSRPYHLRLARLLKQVDNQTEAYVEEIKAEGLVVETALDHYLRGLGAYLDQTSPEDAIHEFNTVLRLDPDNFWARYLLSICYIRLDRPQLAKSNLTACLAHRPEMIWVYLMRGYAEGQLQEFTEAEEDFRTAMHLLCKQECDEQKPDDDTRYALLNNRGVMRFRQPGRFADGVADLREAIALAPDRYEAYVSLSEAYHQQEAQLLGAAMMEPTGVLRAALPLVLRQTEAEGFPLLTRAIERAAVKVAHLDMPEDVLALLYRTRARRQLERKAIDAALQDFQTAIDWEQAASDRKKAGSDRQETGRLSLARAYVERARVLHFVHRFDRAKKDFTSALEIQHAELMKFQTTPSPDQKAWLRQIQLDMANTQRWYAVLLLAEQDYAGAAEALDQYEKLGGPPSAQVYRERGAARAVLGRSAAAIDDFTRSLIREPKDAATLVYRGQQYLSQQYTQQAERDFNHALWIKPDFPEAYAGRGYARAKLNLPLVAVDDAEELVKLVEQQPKEAEAKVADLLRSAARIYSVAALQLGSPLDRNEAFTVQVRYRRRCVQLLEQAMKHKPLTERAAFWRKFIRPDTAFDSVRNLPGFLALDQAYNVPTSPDRPAE